MSLTVSPAPVQRPDPVFIQRFETLTQNPSLQGLYGAVSVRQEVRKEFDKVTAVVSSVFLALAALTKFYSHSRIAMGFALAGTVGLWFSRVTKTSDVTDEASLKAQCDAINNATDGIIEGLAFYTQAKQAAGIKALDGKDFKSEKDPAEAARKAHKEFNRLYNTGDAAPKPSRFSWPTVQAVTYENDEDARVYRTILAIAQEFLKVNFENMFKESIPELLKNKLQEVHNAADVFVHGHLRPANEDVGLSGSFLNLTLDAGNKAVAKAWDQNNT